MTQNAKCKMHKQKYLGNMKKECTLIIYIYYQHFNHTKLVNIIKNNTKSVENQERCALNIIFIENNIKINTKILIIIKYKSI